MIRTLRLLALVSGGVATWAFISFAQSDGEQPLGSPLRGITSSELELFRMGLADFKEGHGLGKRRKGDLSDCKKINPHFFVSDQWLCDERSCGLMV